MTRECGPCTACCTIAFVPELDKKAGTLCALCTSAGCQVYKQRPGSCKSFECEWIKGYLPDDMRPDLSGVMVEQLPSTSTMLVSCMPDATDDVWQSKRVMNTLIDRYLSKGIAITVHTTGQDHILLPEGRTEASVRNDLDRARVVLNLP